MKFSKRQFLTALAGAAVAPTLLLPRKARAQDQAVAQSTPARAKQLLIIYAGGGMRSHALFSLDNAPVQINPYGVSGGAGSTRAAFRLASPANGNPDTTPFQQNAEFLPDWGVNLPTLFGSTLEQFSLLGPVDHNPGGAPVVDRQTAINLMASGNAAGGPGVLTIIGSALQSTRALPPFVIGAPALPFGRTTPGLAGGAPVFIHNPLDIQEDANLFARVARARNKGAIDSWELALRRTLDDELKTQLPAALAHNVDLVARGREQLRAVQEVLSRPQLAFNNKASASAAFETSNRVALSNRRLEQVFLPFLRFQSGGLTPVSNFTDPLGAKMAMAVRLLQYGSPAVAVGFDGFDLHKDEDKLLHTVSRPLGRAIAGLLFVLAGMPGTEGRTRLDEVLVVVVSESGRDNTLITTGYNSAGGSDVRGTSTSRFQVLPIFGAGIKGGRVIGGYTATQSSASENINAEILPTGPVFSSAQLAATMVNSLGVDYRSYISADPIDQIFA